MIYWLRPIARVIAAGADVLDAMRRYASEGGSNCPIGPCQKINRLLNIKYRLASVTAASVGTADEISAC
jgi:hypothetical protein